MKHLLAFLLLAVAAITVQAQQMSFPYSGPKIDLGHHYLQSLDLGQLRGVKGQTYQGMDAWGNTVVSLQNTGIATIYSLRDSTLIRRGQFPLASCAPTNHANVASFTCQFAAQGDKLPLLLVSQAYNGVVNGMKDVIYVERIANDLKSSQLWATIHFNDVHHLCGYAVQWVADNDNGFLYGFANTVSNLDSLNCHRVLKFKMPKLAQAAPGSLITLEEKDMLENYVIEDYYTGYYKQIGQGLMIHNGLLFMPVGSGNQRHPSILYVWDLAARAMRNVLDLSRATRGELEDCAMWRNSLLVQAQGHLFLLDF